MLRVSLRLFLSILPLALTPLLEFFIADGYLNLGGGEKDVLLLIPWILWSLLYLIFFLASWWIKVPVTRGLAYASGGATGVLAFIYVILVVWFSGWLGAKGP